jgi:hypothetical protein
MGLASREQALGNEEPGTRKIEFQDGNMGFLQTGTGMEDKRQKVNKLVAIRRIGVFHFGTKG